MDKYYTNGLTQKRANSLTKTYAKIEKADYGMYDGNLKVALGLEYKNQVTTFWFLTDYYDIRFLLESTNSQNISGLEGKIVEAYKKGSQLEGLSIGKMKKLKK